MAAKKLGYKDVLELKKTKHQAIMETIDNYPKERAYSITAICKGYGLTRDAFYKYKKRYVERIKIESQVLDIVHKRRRILPREGARKLMRSLKEDFKSTAKR